MHTQRTLDNWELQEHRSTVQQSSSAVNLQYSTYHQDEPGLASVGA